MPKFKKGELVWFRHWTGEAKCGRVIRYWKGTNSYELALGTHVFNSAELFATEQEAREKWKQTLD